MRSTDLSLSCKKGTITTITSFTHVSGGLRFRGHPPWQATLNLYLPTWRSFQLHRRRWWVVQGAQRDRERGSQRLPVSPHRGVSGSTQAGWDSDLDSLILLVNLLHDQVNRSEL
ncbi:hypothetical protein D9C73_025327 [Collichthys lucidus]|uniref:Uncharacterized protein n=1 Tax=Collichthys lucidus TaxID=240159 RepID=A0A4U5VVR2_COLLU|nr:hypothetical protein D9C73_025327 [Collichthys lucidus]